MSSRDASVRNDLDDTGTDYDVVIVGAGPAGLCAAAVLAARGVSCVVIDEAPQIGGQICRRPFGKSFSPQAYPWARPYRHLLEQVLDSTRVQWLLQSTVWSVRRTSSASTHVLHLGTEMPTGSSSDVEDTGGFELELAEEGVSAGSITAKFVILATGAYDAPLPVEGWTTPGVVGLGALQTLAKNRGIAEKDRVVVYGTHPLSIIAAAEAARKGHAVAAIVLPQRMHELAIDALKFLATPVAAMKKTPQLLESLWVLARHRVPIRTGRRLERVAGEAHVSRLRLTKWSARGEAEELPCDVVGIGGGFLSSTELIRSLCVDTEWDFDRGGWIAGHLPSMESNAGGIYVAGEVTGVAGAESAAAEGIVAGAAIADRLGVAASRTDENHAKRARFRVRRLAAFGISMARFGWRARARLVEEVTDRTIVCRCEAVSVGAVRDTWSTYRSLIGLRDVKMLTRLGMGPCQARYCGPLAEVLFADLDRPRTDRGGAVPRDPVKPLRVCEMVSESD